MPSPREIKNRLRGAHKTRQITRAMKMVATVKLRRAQVVLEQGLPYVERMRELAASLLALAGPGTDSPFLARRAGAPALFVVLSSDRGLCGSMNANVFRKVMRAVNDAASAAGGEAPATPVELLLAGRKARDFFRARQALRQGGQLFRVREACNFAEADARKIAADCCRLYAGGLVSRVEIFYSEPKSALQNDPVSFALFPLDLDLMRRQAGKLPSDMIFEPSCADMIDDAVRGYALASLRGIMLRTEVGEHTARMMMMDLATKNADELIGLMRLAMNKLRQLSITNELADITTGAEAVG